MHSVFCFENLSSTVVYLFILIIIEETSGRIFKIKSLFKIHYQTRSFIYFNTYRDIIKSVKKINSQNIFSLQLFDKFAISPLTSSREKKQIN